MAESNIRWHRCPGRVEVVTEATKHLLGRDLQGCWITVGLQDVEFQKDGRVHCVHCGSSMQERHDKVPGEYRDVHAEFIVARVLPKEFNQYDPDEYRYATCYNAVCSKMYMPGSAQGSEAVSAIGTACHGGTQFIMARAPKGVKVPDRWTLEAPRHVVGGKPAPGGTPKPKIGQWMRCLFCGNWMKMLDGPSKPERITNEDNDQQWEFSGPAATFRIYRKAEYETLFEPLVVTSGNPVLEPAAGS